MNGWSCNTRYWAWGWGSIAVISVQTIIGMESSRLLHIRFIIGIGKNYVQYQLCHTDYSKTYERVIISSFALSLFFYYEK